MSDDDAAPFPPHNPWRTLQSREVYRNPWVRMREDRVLRPDGQPGIYGVLEMKVATGALAIDAKGSVVLVGQWRYAFDRYSWEIIEGAAEPGEAPQVAAARELKEEAGLGAKRWRRLGPPVCLSNSVTDEVAHIFLAEDLFEVPAAPDATEVLKIRRVPFQTAVAMAESGQIDDSVSVIGLLRADRLLRGVGTA